MSTLPSNAKNSVNAIILAASGTAAGFASQATSAIAAIDGGAVGDAISVDPNYEAVNPDVVFYGVAPPDEPVYPLLRQITEPDFIEVDWNHIYNSDLLNRVFAYLTDCLNGSSDGVYDNVRANAYALETVRNAAALSDAIQRGESFYADSLFPLTTDSTALKLTQENGFNDLDVIRDRRIDHEQRRYDQLEFVVSQGVEIEKQLMMYAPALAEAQAKVASLQTDAYVKAVEALGTEIGALVGFYKAELGIYRQGAKAAQSRATNTVELANTEIAVNRMNAELTLVRAQVDLENRLISSSLRAHMDAATADVTAHAAAGALSAISTRASYSHTSDEGYHNSTSQSASASNHIAYHYERDIV